MDPIKLAGYKSYSDIPNYRRHKGFWTIWLVLPILAIFILITGDVFYKRNGEISTFSEVNIILAMVMAAFWLVSISFAIFEFLDVARLG